MFRINLYTEREERRRQSRRQAGQTAAISVALGINALFVVSLIMGASLLQERRDTLQDEITRLQSVADTKGAMAPELDLAREMYQLRQERFEWSPLLACVAENIPSSLMLHDLQGQTANNRAQGRFELDGLGRSGTVAMADVSGFVGRLRDDPRISAGFPDVSLGSVRSETGEFQIMCNEAKAK